MSIFAQSFVRLRAGERVDRGGNTVEDWSPAAVTRLTVERVSVQPNTQSEVISGIANVRVTGYRVLTEPGNVPDITALDRIEFGPHTYKVDGEVAHWPDPDGDDHIEFVMKRVGGSP